MHKKEKLKTLKKLAKDRYLATRAFLSKVKEMYPDAWDYLELENAEHMMYDPSLYLTMCMAYEQIKNTKEK